MSTPNVTKNNRTIVRVLFAHGILCAVLAIVCILDTGSIARAPIIGLLGLSICSLALALSSRKSKP